MADSPQPGSRSRPAPRTQEEQAALAARGTVSRTSEARSAESGRSAAVTSASGEQEGTRSDRAAFAAVGDGHMLPLGEVFSLAEMAVTPFTDEEDLRARRSTVRQILFAVIEKTFPE